MERNPIQRVRGDGEKADIESKQRWRERGYTK
jgi:hypothetical protein